MSEKTTTATINTTDNTTAAATKPRPPIRSFVRRAGRMTAAQNRAFAEFGEQFLVPFSAQQQDLTQLFGRKAPVVLEIGFGMGDATAHIAALLPEINFLCCEVHQPGVGSLLNQVAQRQLTNIRIISHDAVEVIKQMLAENSLAGVHVFFPDPWHKKRHNKRRLIQAELVNLLTSRLEVGGYIHCATDWQEYAEQMLQVFTQQPQLQNTSQQADGYAEKPAYRPLTKFENRGLKLGHGVWDLVFQRQAD